MKIYSKIILLFFILSTMLLSGCTTYYSPPSSGPTASIASNVGRFTWVAGDAHACTGFLPLAEENDKPIKIPANQMNTLSISYPSSDYYACREVVFSFTPKPNNDYKVFYAPKTENFFKDLFKNVKCVFQLTNLTTQKEEPVYIRKYNTNFWTGEGRCNDKLAEK